jgi:nucleotidyltransferase/DNA polymerase involved in DNA repair
MANLRERAARQQTESQGLQARAEAGGAVAACVRWWPRPAAEWTEAELRLACGARVVAAMRAAVGVEVGYSCSAGLAHSMTLAKLGSSMHKPGAQTVLPSAAMAGALHALPLERIKGLGGKDGRYSGAALARAARARGPSSPRTR